MSTRYAAAIMATKDSILRVRAAVIECSDDEDPEKVALNDAKKTVFPVTDGWSDHNVVLVSIHERSE